MKHVSEYLGDRGTIHDEVCETMYKDSEYIGAGTNPLKWANFPTSQLALTAVFNEARTCHKFADIRDRHIAGGVCDDDGRALKLWSVVAGEFVTPPWYVRIDQELAS